MTDKELEQQLKEKDAEIKRLKEKLNDLNPAFNGHLVRKAEKNLQDLKQTIGKAIHDRVGRELFNKISGKSFYVYSQYRSYSHEYDFGIVFSDKNTEKELLEWFQEKELKDFTQALENFSWAVNNGQ